MTDQAVKVSLAYPPDRDAVSAVIQQGVLHALRSEPELAEQSYYRALTALAAIRPPTNHDRSQTYTYLGQAQRELQKFDAADKSQRLSFQVARAIGGPDHQLTLIAQMDLGFLFDTSRSVEGLQIMASAKDRILKTRGDDPQTVPWALNRYGRAMSQIGRLEEGGRSSHASRSFESADQDSGSIFILRTPPRSPIQTEALLMQTYIVRQSGQSMFSGGS